MTRKIFNTYKELANQMIENSSDGKVSYAILFYDEAIELTKSIISLCPDIKCGGIDISPEEYKGYYLEYFVSLSEDMVLDVEAAWHEKNQWHPAGYLGFDADIVYITPNANMDVIKNIEKHKCYEIDFYDLNDENQDVDDLDRKKNDILDDLDLLYFLFTLFDI